jgi:hypothetical protein
VSGGPTIGKSIFHGFVWEKSSKIFVRAIRAEKFLIYIKAFLKFQICAESSL